MVKINFFRRFNVCIPKLLFVVQMACFVPIFCDEPDILNSEAINSEKFCRVNDTDLVNQQDLILMRQPDDFQLYNFVQWGCALNGSKKYLVAVDNSRLSLDMYVYDETLTPSLRYLQTLSTAAINDVAVYNKDDTHIYLAIATQNNVQIQRWNGTQFNLLSTHNTTFPVSTLAWWVDETNPLYGAYIATADSEKHIKVYGLSQNFVLHLISSIAIGDSPFTSLLWYEKSDPANEILLLDLIGGSTMDSHEYTINVNPITKVIGAVAQNLLPFPMGSLSTCDNFLAIGDFAAFPGCAGVTLYNVDNVTGSIIAIDSVISETSVNATHVYYLAKCCAGNPEYLLAGIGNDTQYTLYLLNPENLNEIIASTSLGSFVNSVAWCCNGSNGFLAVTYVNQSNQAGEIYHLDFDSTGTQMVDLGPIMH